MRIISFILLSIVLHFAYTVTAQQTDTEGKNSIYQDVEFLSHDSLEGREIGTKGEVIAAQYIANRFAEIGLRKPNSMNSYFQEFTKKISKNPYDTSTAFTIEGRNVIGILNPEGQGSIIIGAHYDHLGWGGEGSGSLSTEQAIHNGADDNASGVAGLLYLAEYFSKKNPRHSITFIAFTGEEKGLLGSNYFANTTLSNSDDVSFMINMDMIGRLDDQRRLAIYGIGTSPEFTSTMERVKRPTFQFAMDSSGIGPSDHTSFYLQDIPVLHFFTGQHEQYHKPEDDVELINFEGLKDVSLFIAKLVTKLDKSPDLPFTKTRDPNPTNEKRKFNVTLGVIPDYLYDGVGLKIDGVKEGRSAAAAGIQKGDILLELGQFKIASIYDYMEALGYYQPEDAVSVTVERDNEQIVLDLTFLK